ncbi:MAG: 2-C-methyl-D-erythritol 4-phosphate cytidylyltransferase [Proteobacteria bacterium]|nr:2-C-methyl-D-erythritol 4-phosphate cytidylyltransferase [Pseudomonadota bacterium]
MAIALIVAGGQGLRMEMSVRKQYLELEGTPVLQRTLMVFDQCSDIERIVLVVPPPDEEFCRTTIVQSINMTKEVLLVGGGLERQQSVYNGLLSLNIENDEIVVIHDGVRPFVDSRHIIECIHAAMDCGASVLGVPVSDTLKQLDSLGYVEKTIDRETLWAVQTPQAFQYGLIKAAHDRAVDIHIRATDDASLVEAMGRPVKLVLGSRNNIKITTRDDLVLAAALMKDVDI